MGIDLLFSILFYVLLLLENCLDISETREISGRQNVSEGIKGGGFLLPKHLRYNFDLNSEKSLIKSIPTNYQLTIEDFLRTKQKNGYIQGPSVQITFDNSFGRYGGGNELNGRIRNMKLFSESGEKAFSIKTGPGFAGRVYFSLSSIEVYHRYQQYKAMMGYKTTNKCYSRYCGTGIYDHRHCRGGCYQRSFCDLGICRCYHGYLPSYGSCWNNYEGYRNELTVRKSSSFNPFMSCDSHSNCHSIDMNLICSPESKKCECRRDMKWNEKELECQVYISVDCSIFEDVDNLKMEKILTLPSKENDSSAIDILPSPSKTDLPDDLNPRWDECVNDPKRAKQLGFTTRTNNAGCSGNVRSMSYNFKKHTLFNCESDEYKMLCPVLCNACKEKWNKEYGGLNVDGIQLPNYNLSENENGVLSLNLTDIYPTNTLSTSSLPKLHLRNTKRMPVKKQFCLEVKAIFVKYNEPERIDLLEKQESASAEDSEIIYLDWSVIGGIIIFVLFSLFCVCIFLISIIRIRKDNRRKTRRKMIKQTTSYEMHPSQRDIQIGSNEALTSTVPSIPQRTGIAEKTAPRTSKNYPNELPSTSTGTNFLPYPNTGNSYQAPSNAPI